MGLLWTGQTAHSHPHAHGHTHAHTHADAHPLGKGAVKVKVHLLPRVHNVMKEDGLHIAVQATMEHVNVQISW